MKYSTYKNPLYNSYKCWRYIAKKRNSPTSEEFSTWRKFAEWAEANGYDENSRISYSPFNPFAPEYMGTIKRVDRPIEYIAYEAGDPYELIIASASYVDELAEIVTRMGYSYTVESIISALARNKDERPVEERTQGLIFEKIDLSNYAEDDEPFEERN